MKLRGTLIEIVEGFTLQHLQDHALDARGMIKWVPMLLLLLCSVGTSPCLLQLLCRCLCSAFDMLPFPPPSVHTVAVP